MWGQTLLLSSLFHQFRASRQYPASPNVSAMDTVQRNKRKAVAFSPLLDISIIPSLGYSRKRRRGLTMDRVVYESFAGEQITQEILEEASRLFSENYGTWGKDSGRAGS